MRLLCLFLLFLFTPPIAVECTSIDIIGTGFCRTGTETLQKALNILGYNTYHIKETNKTLANMWIDVLDHGCSNVSLISEKMQESNFTSMVGFPGSLCWENYLKKFPSSTLYIHTERENDDIWLESVINTLFKMWEKFPLSIIIPFGSSKLKSFYLLSQSIWNKITPITPMNDKESLLQAYQSHNKAIRKSIGRRKLLIIDHSLGWKPLCKFLKKPIPNVPYPRLNTREAFDDKMKNISICILVFPICIIGLITLIYYLFAGETIDFNKNRINKRKNILKKKND